MFQGGSPGQGRGYSLAQYSTGIMVLDDNDPASDRRGGGSDAFDIQRLDGIGVQDADRDSFRSQKIAGLEGLVDRNSRGDNGHGVRGARLQDF